VKPYFIFVSTAFFLYGLVWLFNFLDWIPALPTYSTETILFFMVINMVIYRNVVRFSIQSGDLVRIYLLSIALKLMTGLGFLLTVVLLDTAAAKANAILFLVGYIIFTAVEIFLLSRLKKE
jgi:hypothetical protein